MLRPEEHIHRALISTPSHFYGAYVSDDLSVEHSWPSFHDIPHALDASGRRPGQRQYFVLSFMTNPDQYRAAKEKPGQPFPDYSHYPGLLCVLLSVLFGKRFDNNGFLQSGGSFHTPTMATGAPVYFGELAPNNYSPRVDVGIDLNLTKIELIAPFLRHRLDERFERVLYTAGRFYLRSLQLFGADPELAYLDLISAGEVLSRFYEYSDAQLFDDRTLEVLARIRTELEDGPAAAKELKGRLRQIKRRFALTLERLLSPCFFQHTEARHAYASLKAGDIGERIAAAYNLRSIHVHTGIPFGNLVLPHFAILNEVHLGTPIVEPPDFKKALALAPTLIGLERIVRFCLLRFMHLHGARIDPSLDDPEGGPFVAQSNALG